MIWYYSSLNTWAQHFARKRGIDPKAPLPPGTVCLPHAFPSFGDFHTKTMTVKKLLKTGSKSVVLDSGAHHFFNLAGISVTYHVTQGDIRDLDLWEYVQQYIAFIQHNWEAIDYYIELDIADIYGMKEVRAIRREFERAGIFEKCVGGYHLVNGEDDYDAMLTWPSGMVALEGMRRDAAQLPYMRLIRKGYEAGVKVHGFAMTKPDVLKRLPFYSIDSTSWLSPDRHGSIRLFQDDGTFTTLQVGKVTRYRNKAERMHPVAFMKLYDQLIYSINETVKAQRYFTHYWRAKGVVWKETVERHGHIYDDSRAPRVCNDRINDPDFRCPPGTLELQRRRDRGADYEADRLDSP